MTLKKRYKILSFLFLSLIIFMIWFYNRVIYDVPILPEVTLSEDVLQVGENHFRLGNNWLKKNKNGNWESYVEGAPYERGKTIGLLHQSLVQNQEKVFVNEIDKNIPSWFLKKFILLGIAWFNRDLDQDIPLEYRQEIYGISESFSDDYDFVGPKFNRIINYHAAHDIGHAVQNMRIVGCTAFGSWEFNDSTNQMVIGRNFDFFFGDDFAKEKIVLLVNPDQGYKYLSVTWGGFCGVVSGMNEKGLGITLNSAKSEVPTKSGTPVSIVAREILQYAKNIEEAVEISKKYKTFVSESFTISSLEDKKIVVLEKTPELQDVYTPPLNQIVVTNHFQSDLLKDTPLNIEHMKRSESVDRYNRTSELMNLSNEPEISNFSKILRDQKGTNNENIGCSNPKAINQLLAHHSVIFDNVNRIVWVSNYPFQENYYSAYDLNEFPEWAKPDLKFPISIDSLQIKPDDFYLSEGYQEFVQFKKLKSQIQEATAKELLISDEVITDFIHSNLEFYETYRIVGDYYSALGNKPLATENYKKSLLKNIAYEEDREYIQDQLLKLKE